MLIQLLIDATEAGEITVEPLHGPLPRPVRTDVARLRDTFAGVDEAVVVRALTVWAALYGLVSFELFGQFHNVISGNDHYFDVAARELGAFVGIVPAP